MKNKQRKIKKWEIWQGEFCESGYEGRQKPELLDTIYSDTFENAVKEYFKKNNWPIDGDSLPLIKIDERHMFSWFDYFPTYKEAKGGD